VPRFGPRSGPSDDPSREAGERVGAGEVGAPSTIAAQLDDGPLEGRTIEADAVEGRPPKTIDVSAPDGTVCRYCLAQWTQSGRTALYSFLYEV
jgi:hypothetical protein